MKPLTQDEIAGLLARLALPTKPALDLKKLAAPFPVDAVSWRVGSTTQSKDKGMALAYIDARDVMDRLDAVVGPGNWRDEYTETGGFFICKLWIKVDGEWIWKCDGAGKTDVEAEKGMVSDSFKRAAVKWGIGRYLYTLDSPWVPIKQAGRSYAIAPEARPILRRVLEQQAKTYGQRDAERGDHDAPETPPTAPAKPPARKAAAPTEAPAPVDEIPHTDPSAPPAPRHAVLVGDGNGRAGLDGLHAKVLGITRTLDKYAASALKGVLTKIDRAHGDWLKWRDAEAAAMTAEQTAKVDLAMSAFDRERAKIAAAIAQQEQVAANPGADPQSGELREDAA